MSQQSALSCAHNLGFWIQKLKVDLKQTVKFNGKTGKSAEILQLNLIKVLGDFQSLTNEILTKTFILNTVPKNKLYEIVQSIYF